MWSSKVAKRKHILMFMFIAKIKNGPKRVHEIFENDFSKDKIKSGEREKVDSHKANFIFSSKPFLFKTQPLLHEIFGAFLFLSFFPMSFFSILFFLQFSFFLCFLIEENLRDI